MKNKSEEGDLSSFFSMTLLDTFSMWKTKQEKTAVVGKQSMFVLTQRHPR